VTLCKKKRERREREREGERERERERRVIEACKLYSSIVRLNGHNHNRQSPLKVATGTALQTEAIDAHHHAALAEHALVLMLGAADLPQRIHAAPVNILLLVASRTKLHATVLHSAAEAIEALNEAPDGLTEPIVDNAIGTVELRADVAREVMIVLQTLRAPGVPVVTDLSLAHIVILLPIAVLPAHTPTHLLADANGHDKREEAPAHVRPPHAHTHPLTEGTEHERMRCEKCVNLISLTADKVSHSPGECDKLYRERQKRERERGREGAFTLSFARAQVREGV
jgi:hypothetical protein